VQVHYDDGVAIYIAPEPWVGVREDLTVMPSERNSQGSHGSRNSGKSSTVLPLSLARVRQL
jgi:hypothetical protein